MSAKLQACHAVVNNQPKIIAILADSPVLAPRLFTGIGGPGSGTLLIGNNKYCGASSGVVVNATLYNGGAGYGTGVANALLCPGGLQIIPDSVTPGGAIVDFHIATPQFYAAYPANPVSPVGGGGAGVQFLLALQPPDFYIDNTTPTSPVLYSCVTAGTNATSVWAKISGGAGGGGNVWL
jgi:hypothetical protein